MAHDVEVLKGGEDDLYGKMIALLEKGGIETATFDIRSRKTLRDLFEEIAHRDVVLAYVPPTHRVVRCAITVTILIRVPSQRLQLLEVGREFIRTNERHNKLKEWSMSETKKTGEELHAAAIRGLREELQLEVAPEQLKLAVPRRGHEFPMYLSNAYEGIWSYVMIQRFTLDLPEKPWPEMTKTVVDGTMRIYLQWFPY